MHETATHAEKEILLVNFLYQPDEEPGHMLIMVRSEDKEAAAALVNKTFSSWKENQNTTSDFLEEEIENALMTAGIWFSTQKFDVLDIDIG